ncbi:MAG TPA: hypothetical protein VLA16_05865 [Ideonella sp.]|nr:hypothetical protein [Ideonella sp.]
MKVSIKAPKQTSLGLTHKGFVLIGMMRSGSNFIERQLNLLPDVRCHGELFNPAFIGFSHESGKSHVGYQRTDTALRAADELAFLKKVDAACDREIMGSRLFLDHSAPMTARILYDPAIRKVVLSRNLLEAYVSLTTAQETGVWLTTDSPKDKPKPAKVEMHKLMTFALRQSLYYNDIQTVLNQTGQTYLQIDYNEIKDLGKLNEVARFIGSKHQFETVVEPIQKQNPGTLEERILDYPKLMEEMRKRQIARWFR